METADLGLARAAVREVRALGRALVTPVYPATPLLANARSRRWRRAPYLLALVAVAILLPVTVQVLSHDYGMDGPTAGAIATAQAAPLLLAVTRPLQAWWISLAGGIVGAVLLIPVLADKVDRSGELQSLSWPWPPAFIVGYLLLALAIGLRHDRRTLVGVWLVTGIAGLWLGQIRPKYSDGGNVLLFILTGALLILGGALRERGEAQRKLTEQKQLSEAERAQRTLLEERARIARELHDVVAHHMSVITVQADSASYRIGGLPAAAQEEFETIAATARTSLAEMRRLLGVLRSEESGGEREPQPGLDAVPALVESTVRAGVPVELALPDPLPELPQAVGLSAYRIIQEALANVVRHAPGARTDVSVSGTDDRLSVLIVNGPAATPAEPLETSESTGHGLVGMRERVRLVGGDLDTGPLPDGGFRVAARLPVTEDESEGAA
ncbi:sensor histidine kinase [Streptomyces sp. A7024]|uniref:histidine kinase n=1 Tax=Streptomyces coryli TaxID=1128680 RepID=A0A6G4UC57_9ACTN|nr:sensor histidine kinase [Streptomyces coryli]NGN68917.1 sensor histidine kinase [Streptomyces coryli]